MLLCTAVWACFGFDLLDGEVTHRGRGTIIAGASPIRFTLVVLGYQLSSGAPAIGWFAVRAEWTIDQLPPLRPTFEDPDRIRPL